jgi:glycosyltransferase involved in cell wall biosynthesis
VTALLDASPSREREMRCPTLAELAPPPGKAGWPWTGESAGIDPTAAGEPYPRITVVTPSFNHAPFIEETIRSVLLQRYPNLEYVIVDGGSTDGTLDVIRRYERWLAWWVSEPDRGQAHAINKGLRRATGEWVAWINSDDVLYPNALAAIARASARYRSAGLIYGTGAKIDLSGRVIQKVPFRPYDQRLLRTKYFMLQQSSFMRRDALREVGWLDESLQYVMDWDVAMRIGRVYPIRAIADEIGMFRIHPAAKTQGDIWVWGREIATVGRKHNGLTDPNFLAFRLRSWCRRAGTRTRWALFGRIERLISRVLGRVYGAHTFMIT